MYCVTPKTNPVFVKKLVLFIYLYFNQQQKLLNLLTLINLQSLKQNDKTCMRYLFIHSFIW